MIFLKLHKDLDVIPMDVPDSNTSVAFWAATFEETKKDLEKGLKILMGFFDKYPTFF